MKLPKFSMGCRIDNVRCYSKGNIIPSIRNIGNGSFGYGQSCYWDCMDEHRDHGDDMSNPRVHWACENRCNINMPGPLNPKMLLGGFQFALASPLLPSQ